MEPVSLGTVSRWWLGIQTGKVGLLWVISKVRYYIVKK
jgi:hypothetical protein